MERLVEFWVAKTREQVKEEQRQLKIIEIFRNEFSIFPDSVLFEKEYIYSTPTLIAIKEIDLQESNYFIENQKIKKIVLEIRELNTKCEETDWNFSRTKAYQWKKFMDRYKLTVSLYYE